MVMESSVKDISVRGFAMHTTYWAKNWRSSMSSQMLTPTGGCSKVSVSCPRGLRKEANGYKNCIHFYHFANHHCQNFIVGTAYCICGIRCSVILDIGTMVASHQNIPPLKTMIAQMHLISRGIHTNRKNTGTMALLGTDQPDQLGHF